MAEPVAMLSCADAAHEGPRRVARSTFPPHPDRSDWLAPWCGACAARRAAAAAPDQGANPLAMQPLSAMPEQTPDPAGGAPADIPDASGETETAAEAAAPLRPIRGGSTRHVRDDG